MPATTETIQADPLHVWKMISDVRRMGEWSPETVDAEWVGGATEPSVGAKFVGTNKRKYGWKGTCTVTAAEPGREFAFDVGKGETTWRYLITPHEDGCEVTESYEIVKAPGAIGRWLYKVSIGKPWSEREADLLDGMQETLRRLKAAAETGG